MALVAIEIVDAGLAAAREGVLYPPSPGLALLDPAGLVTGSEAAAQERLKPVFAFDRFWTDLSTEALPRPLPQARSRADLAYAQLVQVWAGTAQPGDEALFAVPGSMRPRELGLLAGIAAAAGIPVAGFVDAAIAACAPLEAGETVLCLDLQLHQSVLTEMHGVEALVRRRVEIAPRVGLKALRAAWAQLVSEAMVRRTRFDPQHHAASEQQLYDRLPEWLAALSGSDVADVELEASSGRFAVSLRREQFVLAAEAYYTQLADLVHAARRAGEPVTLALSARAAALPGLAERCASLGDVAVMALTDGAASLGTLSAADEITAAGTASLVTALGRVHPAAAIAPHTQRSRGTSPTHVVYGGRAHAITEEPLALGRAQAGARSLVLAGPSAGVSGRHCVLVREGDTVIVRDRSRHGTFVNGERVSGSAPLAAGDRLRIGTPGVVLELVAVG